jgi:hypothetical protein
MKTDIHFWSYLVHFFLEWEMFQSKVAGKIKTYNLCSTSFFSLNRAVYEIMWKNITEPGRPQMAIRRMRIACCITKARNTHSEYVILIGFRLQQRLYKRASMLRCTYIGCLFVTGFVSRSQKNNLHGTPTGNTGYYVIRIFTNTPQRPLWFPHLPSFHQICKMQLYDKSPKLYSNPRPPCSNGSTRQLAYV